MFLKLQHVLNNSPGQTYSKYHWLKKEFGVEPSNGQFLTPGYLTQNSESTFNCISGR